LGKERNVLGHLITALDAESAEEFDNIYLNAEDAKDCKRKKNKRKENQKSETRS
jgi:hypothetical protein